MMQVKPSQLKALIVATIEAGLNLLVQGGPGIGKSNITKQAAAACDADHIISNPAVEDPTNAAGLPWVGKNKEEAVFLPFGQTAKVLKATKKTVWNLEDLGQASAATQAAYMHWLLARELNGHRLPDCVSIVATTNRRTDRAGVTGILEPVKSRFATIVELVPDLDEWCDWYLTQPFMVPEILAFQRLKRGEQGPDKASGVGALYQFVPSADLVNCPLPRTWENASRLLKLNLAPDVEAAALAGAIGEGAATEFLGFRRMYRELPSLDDILKDPDGIPLPRDLSAMYATVCGLAAVADAGNFGKIARYVNRLADAGKGDFASLLVRDATRRTPLLQQTGDFAILMSGEVGKLVTGAV